MCASGVCNAGFCSGVAPNNGCFSDSDCASLQCGPTYTTICGSNGFGPCNTFQSCNPVSAIGGVCSVDGDCTAAGGVCSKVGGSSTGTCQVATSSTTTSTSTSATTSTTTSTTSTSTSSSTTTSTTSTSTTASTTTTTSTSTPSATPPYANGLACNPDTDCISGYCAHPLLPDFTRSPTGTCQAKKAFGEACYTSHVLFHIDHHKAVFDHVLVEHYDFETRYDLGHYYFETRIDLEHNYFETRYDLEHSIFYFNNFEASLNVNRVVLKYDHFETDFISELDFHCEAVVDHGVIDVDHQQARNKCINDSIFIFLFQTGNVDLDNDQYDLQVYIKLHIHV
ncbi:hypothetical protein CF319_g9400 [Tilletia indica]|nr:hypothetical protein CF319_g9400 [Tilletia indica]